ncbi:hypothetical protein B296_00042172 [Ensete ventricosum]|uniref:Uncharacterized protein n=1 Tax=Ensete ventricosum TaxID=4639 RepID=A0A426XT26_ENSVE|nr:hypothetical protein B296_00042172 [Ensete ventricosum]
MRPGPSPLSGGTERPVKGLKVLKIGQDHARVMLVPFDPLPYRRGPPETLKVVGGALRRDLGHGLKLNLEGALAWDEEVEASLRPERTEWPRAGVQSPAFWKRPWHVSMSVVHPRRLANPESG